MAIDVVGWFGKGNVGDEAYKTAYGCLLPDRTIRFLTPADFHSLQLTGSDPVFLGGGDVVQGAFTRGDGWEMSRRKRVISVTLTDRSDFEFLRFAEKVWVRDLRSLEVGRQNGITAEYLPDLTFVLTADPERGKRLIQEAFRDAGHELRKQVVVVVMNAHLSPFGLDDLGRDQADYLKVTQEMARVFDEADASFLFVPFSTNPPSDDRVSNGFVASRCKWYRKNVAVYDRLDPQVVLDLISAADAVVSTRLHASIFATIGGTPFVDITHHDKNRGFIETVGIPDWSVDYWDFQRGTFRDRLETALAYKGASVPLLEAYTRESRNRLHNVDLLR